MKSHVRWLHAQLPELVRKGVLHPDQAEQLRAHYGPVERADPLARALLVTAALAAILIGSGVILIVAHNWEEIPRLGRSAIGFGLLIAAQGLAAFALLKRRGSEAWIEATSLLVVFALGACMAIVAQAWRLTWSPEGFLLSWLLLSIPLIYVMRASLLLPLAWFGAFCWSAAAFEAQQESVPILGFLGLALALAPAHVEFRRRAAMATRSVAAEWAAALALALVLPSFWPGALEWMRLSVAASVLVLLFSLDTLVESPTSPRGHRAFHGIGGIGLFVVVFVASFKEPWSGRDAPAWPVSPGHWALALLGALLILGTLGALAQLWRTRREAHEMALGALPLGLVLADLVGRRFEADVAALLVNAFGVAVGGLALASGLRRERLFRSNAGIALLGALLMARFFDAEWSFAWRGGVFIALGLAILGLNLWMVTRKRRKVSV